jgi:hypothetical protein
MANVLSIAKKTAVITALVEGCSVRSTSRMTGVAKGTILRLPAEVGTACSEYQSKAIRNVSARRVQVNEIWNFCYCKQKNLTPEIAEDRIAGDVWTFTAIDADTKLVISWLVGRRDAGCAAEFLQDVAGRLSNRIQLTSDGHRMYLDAASEAFGGDVDFAQLVKTMATTLRANSATARRNGLALSASTSLAIPILSTSAPATWNGRISI